MKKIYILLAVIILAVFVGDAYAQRSKHKSRSRHKTTRTVKRPKHKTHKRTARYRYKTKKRTPVDPTLRDPFYVPSELQCEDTCSHVHGIDLSHYQGQVFWEHVGQNMKMTYVYLKATEGGDRIDDRYERNIQLAHRYGIKVGSYHFFRPKSPAAEQLRNFRMQCRPAEQDLIPMIDIETTGGLSSSEFCDSLIKFLGMVEKEYRQPPLLYTFRNFYNWHLQGMVNDYKLMIAMYQPEEPVLEDRRDITMWQYTSKGRLKGISGYVDKSRFMGNHGLRDIRFQHVHFVEK
jgi:lysozyme